MVVGKFEQTDVLGGRFRRKEGWRWWKWEVKKMWGFDVEHATALYPLSLRRTNMLNIVIWTSYVARGSKIGGLKSNASFGQGKFRKINIIDKWSSSFMKY